MKERTNDTTNERVINEQTYKFETNERQNERARKRTKKQTKPTEPKRETTNERMSEWYKFPSLDKLNIAFKVAEHSFRARFC